jgi:hypothetical protein
MIVFDICSLSSSFFGAFFGFKPSKSSLANECFYGILQMDAFFGDVTMSPVVSAPLCFVLPGLGHSWFGELDITFLEVGVKAF